MRRLTEKVGSGNADLFSGLPLPESAKNIPIPGDTVLMLEAIQSMSHKSEDGQIKTPSCHEFDEFRFGLSDPTSRSFHLLLK